MVAQLKLELPPLPPLPLDLPPRGFAPSSSAFTPTDGPMSSAESPRGVLSVGEGGRPGDDISGGLTAALLMLSRCVNEGLMSSAAACCTGGVAYAIKQPHHNIKRERGRSRSRRRSSRVFRAFATTQDDGEQEEEERKIFHA